MQHPGYLRLIGIALDKTHDQLSPFPYRRERRTLQLPGQGQPAMTGRRPFALIKPVELHRYRPLRVRAWLIDLDDPRPLRAMHPWFDRRTGRFDGCRPVQGTGLVVVRRRRILAAPMLNAGQQPEPIAIGNRMTGQRHQSTAAQGCQVRPAFGALHGRPTATPTFELPHHRSIALAAQYHRFAGWKMLPVITKHHTVPAGPVFEVVVKPLLGAQSLEKLQV
ncbi:hypothetical protein D3C78_1277940 [compost metagenome]